MRVVCTDSFPNRIVPNLADEACQEIYGEYIREVKPHIVFIDNYCAFVRALRSEGDSITWSKVAPWINSLRSEGIAVIMVHHAGKGGSQLGTSTKEFGLDWIIKLTRPHGYKISDGARFIIDYEKARDFDVAKLEPIMASLINTSTGIEWAYQSTTNYKLNEVKKLITLGCTNYEIREELNLRPTELRFLLDQIEKEKMYAENF